MRATWLPEVLHDAGLRVVLLDGWKERGGDLVDLRAVVWHHDGSPPGASPSVPQYMAGQIDQGKPGAQCWVGLDGTWHLVASGKVFHTGQVLTGKPGNSVSLGVETDHTTGEPWSGVVLLDSLRRGTAAVLRRLGEPVDRGLEFHKTICSPPGRKNDPDGLDLTTERRAVAALATPLHTTSHSEDLLLMIAKDDADARRAWARRQCLDFWGREPAADHLDYYTEKVSSAGADAVLGEIFDHSFAQEFRKRRGW